MPNFRKLSFMVSSWLFDHVGRQAELHARRWAGQRHDGFVAMSVARRCDHLLAPHSVVPVLFAADALPSRQQQT
jgi:hypothetical protein